MNVMETQSLIGQLVRKYHWDDMSALRAIVAYEQFLRLRANGATAAPSETVEKVWRQHLLNTRHYMVYCKQKFNKYIHHDINPESDIKVEPSAFTATVLGDRSNGQPISVEIRSYDDAYDADANDVRVYRGKTKRIPFNGQSHLTVYANSVSQLHRIMAAYLKWPSFGLRDLIVCDSQEKPLTANQSVTLPSKVVVRANTLTSNGYC